MQGITITLDELLALRHVANQICLPQPKSSRSSQHGDYHSPFRGRGMDFLENRVYQPGDDIRSINWAVTARTGKTHTKIYQQERERPVYIILDFNDSMYFGTKVAYKSVIAAKTAALIAWAALKNGDRVGSVLVKDTGQILRPCHSKQNLMQFLKSLVSFVIPESNGYIGIDNALKKLKRTIKSGSLIYVISDFYNLNKAVEQELYYLAKNHDVTNILIYDPLEKTPPKDDRYLFHDFRNQKSMLLDTHSRLVNKDYETIFRDRITQIKKLCYVTGMQLIELATNDDLAKMLRQILPRKMFQ